VCQIGLVNDGA
jgi:hypothetical protein